MVCLYEGKSYILYGFSGQENRNISQDLLSLEQKDLKDYPQSLLIVGQANKNSKKQKESGEHRTKRLKSSILPQLKSFFDKVSQEKEEEELQIGEPIIDDTCDSPQVQLSVMFCELSNSKKDLSASDSDESS